MISGSAINCQLFMRWHKQFSIILGDTTGNYAQTQFTDIPKQGEIHGYVVSLKNSSFLVQLYHEVSTVS